jgi:hypothetical protein
LSYLTNNFDWQANYIAELSPGGDRLSLFAWMTLANGDDTSLQEAATQAVAGKLNSTRVDVPRGEWKPIVLNCWPQGKTSDIPLELSEDIVVTGSRVRADAPPAPPPPPPAAAERGGDEVALQAVQEELGDVKLYRIPEPVTVAGRSQKQVAMISKPLVKVQSILRLRPQFGDFAMPLQRVLITTNRTAQGLGLPLPAGKVALFGRREGRRILLGEGSIDDYAVGEKVEIPVATATGLLARQTMFRRPGENNAPGYELVLSNDLGRAQTAEVKVTEGLFTFVALDENNRPRPVGPT